MTTKQERTFFVVLRHEKAKIEELYEIKQISKQTVLYSIWWAAVHTIKWSIPYADFSIY